MATTCSASHWEIARDQAFENPVLEKRVDGRTALVLSAGILDPSSDYWVRSRHQDSRGSLSAWSQPVMFSTAATLPGDANANGIDDGSEVVGFADTNGNGMNDADEGICDLAPVRAAASSASSLTSAISGAIAPWLSPTCLPRLRPTCNFRMVCSASGSTACAWIP